MVTIKDISKESGYSQSTISRLFKDDSSLSITKQTKDAIINTALSLGYDRAKIHTALYKIGILFWIPKGQAMEDIYFMQMRDALLEYGKRLNMEMTVITERENIKNFPKLFSGFIAIGEITKEELQFLYNQGMQGVVLEINPLPYLFDTVKPDTDFCITNGIDILVNNGIKSIGFLGGRFHNPQTNQDELDSREIIFRSYMRSLNLLKEEYVFSDAKFTVEQGYKLACKMTDTLGKNLPEACIIASDTLAVGALQGFHEKKIILPQDMKIISINDYEISQFVSPPLTTYHIDTQEMAKTSIDLLSEQLVYQRKISKTVLLGSTLIIRKSFIPIC